MIVSGEEVCKWVVSKIGGTYTPGTGAGIGIVRNGVLVGGSMFENFNGRSVMGHVASDGSRRWLSREYLRYVFRYVFQQLGALRLIVTVDSTNADSLEFVRGLGFQRECVITDAGRTGDLVVLSLSKEQCRFLEV